MSEMTPAFSRCKLNFVLHFVSPSCLSSRPKRHRNLIPWRISSAEWRDPDTAYFAMPIRGVLPRLILTTSQCQNERRDVLFASISRSAQHVAKGTITRTIHRRELLVAAWSGMAPRDPSTPRHKVLMGPRLPRRSGRDDILDRFSKRDGIYRAPASTAVLIHRSRSV